MSVMAVTWTFCDGVQNHPCTSFPYAFRSLFNTMKKGVEKGRSFSEMEKEMFIVSPLGRTYNYLRAKELAEQQGLLTPDGSINSREFKRK